MANPVDFCPERTPARPGLSRRALCRGAAGLTLGAALAGPLAPIAATRAEGAVFRIGAGAVDSPSFAVAGLIAAALTSPAGGPACERGGSCGVAGMIAAAQASTDPAEALDQLLRRQIDAVLLPAVTLDGPSRSLTPAGRVAAHAALAHAGLRSLGTVYLETVMVLIRVEGGTLGYADLKRRRVAFGLADGGTPDISRALAAALDLPGSVSQRLRPDEAVLSELAAGSDDAAVLVATLPQPRLTAFIDANPIRALRPTDEELRRLTDRLPYLVAQPVDAGSYALPEGTHLPALPTQILVTADADAGLIEAVTAALWHQASLKLLAGGGVEARSIRREHALDGLTLPLHPGAARYYQQAGMTLPA